MEVDVADVLTPMNCWNFLRTQDKISNTFFDGIVRTLAELSFEIDSVQAVLIQLRLSLPLMHTRLVESKHVNRRIKIAHDIAAYLGFKEIAKLKRTVEAKLIFEAALIVILSFNDDILREAEIIPFSSMGKFLSVYPEFVDCDAQEQRKLLEFCNFMKYGVMLLSPPKWKKAHLLDLSTRLTEGCKKKYHCGGGQTPATNRRVLIYERESGVTPNIKPPSQGRIPWDALATAVNTCSDDLNDQLMQTIQECDLGSLSESSASFCHPFEPSIQVDTSELVSNEDNTIVRTVAVKKLKPDAEGNMVWSDLAASVSVSRPYDSAHADFWNDIELSEIEFSLSDDINVSRQSSCIDGQLIKGVSISKQKSVDDWDLDFLASEVNLSDMMRGGSLFPARRGASGLLRTFSGPAAEKSSSALWAGMNRALSKALSAPNTSTWGSDSEMSRSEGDDNDTRRKQANLTESEWKALLEAGTESLKQAGDSSLSVDSSAVASDSNGGDDREVARATSVAAIKGESGASSQPCNHSEPSRSPSENAPVPPAKRQCI